MGPTELRQHMQTIKDAPARLDEVATNLSRELAELKADRDLNPAARNQRMYAERTKAQNKTMGIRDEVMSARRAVESYTTKTLAERDNTANLEAGLHHDRTWARLSRRLETGTTAGELVEEVATSGDPVAIRALRRELPEWLNAQAPREGVDSASAMQTATHAAERLVERLDRAELPRLPFRHRDALTARLELPHRLEVVDAKVRHAFSGKEYHGDIASALAQNEAERQSASLQEAARG